jgi:hypothetical protein
MPQPKESTPSPYQFGEETGGVTPPTGVPSGKFLRDDGTWQTASGGGGTTNIFTSVLEGIVPASGGGSDNFLRADGNWEEPYTEFTLTTPGLVPAPTTSTGKFLKDDGTWGTSSSGVTTVFTSVANGLVPLTGGSALTTFLRADGTWVVPTDTTYSAFTPTVSGLVPGPETADATAAVKFLRVDGTWVVPTDTDTTYTTFSTSGSGLVPTSPDAGTTKFLRQDGDWIVPTDTTYNLFTSSAAGLAPKTGVVSINASLRANGTWAVPTDTTYSAFSGGVTGLVPGSDNGTTTFLRADGTFATPSDDTKADKASSNTFGGTQDFTNAPTCSDAATANTELVNKLYVDTVDTAIIAGSVLKGFPVIVTASHFFTGGLSFSSVAPTTSVTPSSANDIANKAYVDSVAGSPKMFLAIGTSTASFANSTIDITWGTPEISDSDITLSSNELTFAVAGTYTIDLSARMSGNNRVESTLRTFKDTGGGYSELTDHTSSNYNLRDTDQNTGSTVLSTMLTLAAGDKLKFQITGDTDGTAVLTTAGTILRVIGYA